MPGYVEWFTEVEKRFTQVNPLIAHEKAVAEAAGIAAKAAMPQKGWGMGNLARDVSLPARISTSPPLFVSEVGSGAGGRAPLPYAREEYQGGTIYGKPYLYLRDRRGTTKSTFGGKIMAVKTSVPHTGKFYLDPAKMAYPALFIAAYGSGL